MAAAAIPFAMKAAPWIASGVGSLIGKKLSGPSKAQTSAMQGTQQAANQVGALSAPLLQQGTRLASQGSGYLQQGADRLGQAGSYYQNVLGSRSAGNAALAPERTTALDYYGGAERKAKRSLVGASRDTALAELDRQKVGQLSGMLGTARKGAAEGLERTGSGLGALGNAGIYGGGMFSGQGANAATWAAYLNSGLFNQASQLKQQEQEGGKAWGGFMYDLVKSMPWGKGGGGGGGSTLPYKMNFSIPGYR